MKKRSWIPIKTWLLIAVAVVVVMIGTIQVIWQYHFTNYVEQIYESNIAIATSRIASEITDTFTDMNHAVLDIADSSVTSDFTSTEITTERYTKAYNNVRPLVNMAIHNLDFDMLAVLDSTGSWYSFEGGSLSTAGSAILKENLPDDSLSPSNAVIEIDGQSYYSTMQAIIRYRNDQPARLGYVVALTSISKTQDTLIAYGEPSNFTITVHDNAHVLISNDATLTGMPLSSLYTDDLYLHEEEILPGKLGVTISIPNEEIFPQRLTFVISMLTTGLVSLLLILILMIFLNTMLIRPFTQVIDETRQLGDQNPERRLTQTKVAHVDALVTGINAMLSRLEEYNEQAISAQHDLYEMEISQRETQLYLLRNQINQHFLYNSLISVRTLADHGENHKVKKIATGIAELLRYVTSTVHEVNIFDEMEIVNKYVGIQNIRCDNKIQFDIDVDDRLCEYRILKLLLQPLVENSLFHGLEQKQDDHCMLRLRGNLLKDSICIEVSDNGAGISNKNLKKLQERIEHYETADMLGEIEGIALVNIQKRIRMAYGSKYSLTIDSVENEFTRAILTLPKIPDD